MSTATAARFGSHIAIAQMSPATAITAVDPTIQRRIPGSRQLQTNPMIRSIPTTENRALGLAPMAMA